MKGKKKSIRRHRKPLRIRKQAFSAIFMKYFLVIGTCASILFLVSTYLGIELYEKRYQIEKSQEIEQFNQSILKIDSFYSIDGDEVGTNEVNKLMITKQKMEDVTSFLYHMDNGKEITATPELPCVLTYWGENLDMADCYIAGESYSDFIKEIEETKEKYRHDERISVDIDIKSIYVKDNVFYFGSVTRYLRENGQIISEAHYDFKPKNRNDLTQITSDSMEIVGPYYTDAQITKTNRDYLEQQYRIAEKFSSGQIFTYDTTVDSHLWKDSFVVTCNPSYSEDTMESLCIVYVYHYNLWQICRKWVIIAAIATVLLILLISYALSWRQYMLQKLQWETLSYRKNLTNIMAHDLRTPLTAISGYAENIINESNPEKNDFYLQNIVDNIQYMKELIQHILVISGEVDNQQQPHTEKIELAEMTEEILLRHAEQAGEKNIRVHQSGNCTLSVNATWFATVLENLINNAVRHGKRDSTVTIRIDRDSYTITNFVQSTKTGHPSENNGGELKGMGMAIIREILEYYGFSMQLSQKDKMYQVTLLFHEAEKKNHSYKNIIVDEDAGIIYADCRILGKKEQKIIDRYLKKGYSLVDEKSEKPFIAPHNMGIH